MAWKVQTLVDYDEVQGMYRDHEIAVVEETNTHGQKSWGWGSLNKIILFGNCGGNNEGDYNNADDRAFMMKCANILCDGLNRGDWQQ